MRVFALLAVTTIAPVACEGGPTVGSGPAPHATSPASLAPGSSPTPTFSLAPGSSPTPVQSLAPAPFTPVASKLGRSYFLHRKIDMRPVDPDDGQ